MTNYVRAVIDNDMIYTTYVGAEMTRKDIKKAEKETRQIARSFLLDFRNSEGKRCEITIIVDDTVVSKKNYRNSSRKNMDEKAVAVS